VTLRHAESTQTRAAVKETLSPGGGYGPARLKRSPVWGIMESTSDMTKGEIMELTAVLMPAPEGGYVALNPETGTTTQGETVEEALSNLREATELYLEEFPRTTVGRPLLTTFQVTAYA
jgi:predicted RNase H-like HicB family nuclease